MDGGALHYAITNYTECIVISLQLAMWKFHITSGPDRRTTRIIMKEQ